MSRERMIGSKRNKKKLIGLICGLILPVGWFGPQLEKILGISHSEPIMLTLFVQFFKYFFWLICLSKIKSGFSFANQGTIKARLVSRSCDPKTKSIVG